MKKKFAKLWSTWCQKVEKHNEPLRCYEYQEEVWEPKMIFWPLIFGGCGVLLWTVYAVSAWLLVGSKVAKLIFLLKCIPAVFFVVLVISAVGMWLNWLAYSRK